MEVETTQRKTVKDIYTPEELKTLFGTESVSALETRLLSLNDDSDLKKLITETFKTEKLVTKLINTLTNEPAKTALASYIFWSEPTTPESKESIITHNINLLTGNSIFKIYEAAKQNVFPFIAKSRVLKSLIQILDFSEKTVSLNFQLDLCRQMLAWADPDVFKRRKEVERARKLGDSEKLVMTSSEAKKTRSTSSFIVYRLALRECRILYSIGISAKTTSLLDESIFSGKSRASSSMEVEKDNEESMVSEKKKSTKKKEAESVAFEEGLVLIEELVRELKIIDERVILVEAQLLESKFHSMLRNPGRSKASLTAAKSGASLMYCPQGLQAELDYQSGVINADEKDFRTAFSYFFESFEGFIEIKKYDSAEDSLAAMLLCKIMMGLYDDINQVVNTVSKNRSVVSSNGSFFLRLDENPKVKCMFDISKACKERSLGAFLNVLSNEKYRFFLNEPVNQSDSEKKDGDVKCSANDVSFTIFLRSHFVALYNTLIEKNISKIIEPFSCVQVAHVAKIIDLPPEAVEKKISQMILDKMINGILDQGAGTLIIFDDSAATNTPNYGTTIDIIHGLDRVVDSLYALASKQ